MANTTQPTIIWKQYKLEDSDFSKGNPLSGNTVDYNAVQAGQYSPAICVRPQFSQSTPSTSIGSVRLWWSTYSAKGPNDTQNTTTDLPANGWVLKYYVTDCTVSLRGDTTSTLPIPTRCAKMLKFLSTTDKVTQVATSKTFTTSVQFDNTQQAWCKSVWQENDALVSMQPVPFSGYKDNPVQHVKQFAIRYGSNENSTEWLDIIFGDSTLSTTDLLYYAIGGVLSGSAYKCNIKGYINSNDTDINNGTSGFPYIFFTIKAPSDADAGTWSGWACRISYIWPYTQSSTNL